MKKFSHLLSFLICITFLTFLFSGCDSGTKEEKSESATAMRPEAKPDTTMILLKVKTRSINQNNVTQSTALYSSLGDTTEWNNHNKHTSRLRADKWVTWKGEADDNTGVRVNIVKIEHKNNGEFDLLTKKGPYTGTNVITQKVKNNPDSTLSDEYSIFFMVEGKADTFEIDPILRMKTTTL